MKASALAALALSVAFGAPPATAAAPATTLAPVLHASEGWLGEGYDAEVDAEIARLLAER